MLLFTWQDWQDCSDRYKGHPSSITQLVKMNENEVLSGCSDGVVRRIGILPNTLLENVCSISKSAKNVDGDGIERLRVSSEGLLGISTMEGVKIFQHKPEDLFDKTLTSVSSDEDSNPLQEEFDSDEEEQVMTNHQVDSDEEYEKPKKKPKIGFQVQCSFDDLD
jgi:hypothetical protein